MVARSIELLELEIIFEITGPIKSQVLADFIDELTPVPKKEVWILNIDGSSNI